jgi:hypothetical protein
MYVMVRHKAPGRAHYRSEKDTISGIPVHTFPAYCFLWPLKVTTRTFRTLALILLVLPSAVKSLYFFHSLFCLCILSRTSCNPVCPFWPPSLSYVYISWHMDCSSIYSYLHVFVVVKFKYQISFPISCPTSF